MLSHRYWHNKRGLVCTEHHGSWIVVAMQTRWTKDVNHGKKLAVKLEGADEVVVSRRREEKGDKSSSKSSNVV